MDFDSCMEYQQSYVHIDSKENYLYYELLRQSRNQHIILKVDIQNDFTIKNNQYPKSHPKTLHLLDKYSKIAVPKMPASEGSSFAQGDSNKGNVRRDGGNKRGGYDKTYNKKYWKGTQCYTCVEKGHPASHCTKTKKDKYNDDKSMKTTSGRASVNNLVKDANKISGVLTTVKYQLQRLKEAYSYLSDSEDEDESSHFQMADINFGKSDFQFAQLDEEFKPCIASILNQNYKTQD